MAWRLACGEEVEWLVTVAPAVTLFGETETCAPSGEWLLVQGSEDEVIDPESVLAWADRLPRPPRIEVLEAGHFFHGRLNPLREAVLRHLGTGG